MLSKLRWTIKNGGWSALFKARRNQWKGSIQFGRNVTIGKDSIINNYMGGNLVLGDGCTVCRNCKISTCGGDLHIGNNVTIGDRAIITAQGNVAIEDDVLFADRVTIIANEHFYQDITTPIMYQGGYSRPIRIGKGSWIGVNVTILQGSDIGKNCVIGAGSVVKGVFPDYCVLAGNPAKIIKVFNKENETWEKS